MSGEGILQGARWAGETSPIDLHSKPVRQAMDYLHAQVATRLAQLPQGWRVATRLRQSDRAGFYLQLRWDTRNLAPGHPEPNPNEWTIWGPLP